MNIISVPFLAVVVGLVTTCAGDLIYHQTDHYGRWPVVKALKVNQATSQCRYENNPTAVTNLIRRVNTDDKLIKINSSLEFQKLLEKCHEYEYSVMYDNYFGLTWPGTKWCGPGDVAANFDDLGSEREADLCCRAHDHCDDLMHAFTSKNNLSNMAFVTRLHCKCDEAFHSCLHDAKSETANSVGEFFFNLVQNPCYKNDHPIVKCVKAPQKGNCNEYELDETQPKKWQWFNSKSFH